MNRTVIIEESMDGLPDYARIPMTFEVSSVFDVQPVDQGLGGLTLSERMLDQPWLKNYDDFGDPASWAKRWDISNWGILAAYAGDSRVGGCAIAYDTPEVHKLGERREIAVLWDIRIHPNFRGNGIGSGLLDAAVEWAVRRDCRLLTAETQNTNVRACRFYAKNGFMLGAVTRFAYVEFPYEVELVWYKQLEGPTTKEDVRNHE